MYVHVYMYTGWRRHLSNYVYIYMVSIYGIYIYIYSGSPAEEGGDDPRADI